jgi:hypothetical protein
MSYSRFLPTQQLKEGHIRGQSVFMYIFSDGSQAVTEWILRNTIQSLLNIFDILQ